MNESILKALMRLFSIVATVNREESSDRSRRIVESYLNLQLNKELVSEYLQLYDEYIANHKKKFTRDGRRAKKRTSLNSVKVLMICHEINEQLQQKDKVIVLLRLFEFVGESTSITDKELEFVKTVADTFNISEREYYDMKAIVTETVDEIKSKKQVLIVDNIDRNAIDNNEDNKIHKDKDFKYIYKKQLDGKVIVYHVASTNTLIFRLMGEDILYLNSHNITPYKTYVFDNGSVIKSPKITPVYYSDVAGKFIQAFSESKILFSAKDIEFKFKNSENGVQKFSFYEESGHLIGIMGGSGVGKSTLLNVFNGTLKIISGQIKINGYDLYNDKEKLEGVIGFVPQDDLLIEELNVFQNLYYNAKLCFSNYNDKKINEVVEKILIDLDLIEIKHLKVGSSLNKFISGGQRKRLNIALELIREPSVLIVDEPTSGLSSMDSEIVMSLLKEQTIKGKLVIVNIHQPSSDIYKLFDRLLMMDKGGYPVYYGNPVDAIVYFKTISGHANALESECGVCGNVNAEQTLQILEAKMVNEYGKFTRTRKVEPTEWYSYYKDKIETKNKTNDSDKKIELPFNNFKIPNKFKQFKIFSIRNILSKLTNKQYLLINFLEAPLLAIILGYFTKYISGTAEDPNAYLFSENVNIPAYLFMSVIVALFLGLSVSAEEIIRDRRILKRESFLNLSHFSYINSKVVVLFALSAIQSISYILIGNTILGIQGMTISYWIILFSTFAAANLIGLNLSSSLNSVVTIYITIPFILVPQLLFSGVIVSFSKLHKNFTSIEYVPIIGDLMTSRWAFEALAVNQFRNNEYQKHFFNVDKRISNASYNTMYLIPELKNLITDCQKDIKKDTNQKIVDAKLAVLAQNFKMFDSDITNIKFEHYDKLNYKMFSNEIINQSATFIEYSQNYYSKKEIKARNSKDKILRKLTKKTGDAKYVQKLKQDNYNKRLSSQVLNKNEIDKIVETDNYRLVQIIDPVYKTPILNNGRAHFYAAEKKVFGKTFNTVWFNTAVIWLTTIIAYILLLFDVLRRIIDYFDNIKIFKK